MLFRFDVANFYQDNCTPEGDFKDSFRRYDSKVFKKASELQEERDTIVERCQKLQRSLKRARKRKDEEARSELEKEIIESQ